MKKTVAILSAAALLFCLTACTDKNNTGNNGDSYEYNYSATSTQTDATASDSTVPDVKDVEFTVDKSWQKNYHIAYSFYDRDKTGTLINVKETKTDSVFAVEYVNATNPTLYYKANGKDVDLYVIESSVGEQKHTLMKNTNFALLTSLFMKLSNIEAGFPKLSNVVYQNDETVAGRNCHKYIQRAYTDGEATETVYVWVDAEFGFVAKCQAVDAQYNTTTNWEITEFTTGGVTEKDTGISLSSYKFTDTQDITAGGIQ